MIGNGTFLKVTDNSGAKVAQVINQSGKSWGIGDIITVAIKRSQPRSKIAAGTVQKAVITETVKELRRPDGSSIGFARNACVLVNSKGAPLGTRVLGFAAHELRARGLMKVLSLTARVL